jgi:hypothetical protein
MCLGTIKRLWQELVKSQAKVPPAGKKSKSPPPRPSQSKTLSSLAGVGGVQPPVITFSASSLPSSKAGHGGAGGGMFGLPTDEGPESDSETSFGGHADDTEEPCYDLTKGLSAPPSATTPKPKAVAGKIAISGPSQMKVGGQFARTLRVNAQSPPPGLRISSGALAIQKPLMSRSGTRTSSLSIQLYGVMYRVNFMA